MNKKVKNFVLWTYVIEDLNGEKKFTKKNLQKKKNQKQFRVEEVINRKSDKLYVKWKGYNTSCKYWIDKKDTYIKWIIFQNHKPVAKTK